MLILSLSVRARARIVQETPIETKVFPRSYARIIVLYFRTAGIISLSVRAYNSDKTAMNNDFSAITRAQ